MMHNEWGLNRLPVPRQSGWVRRSIVWPFAARKRIKLGVGSRELAGLLVKPPHFYAVPEAAECKPCVALLIEYNVRVNRVEIVPFFRFEDQTAILPGEVSAPSIQGSVREQSNSRSVLSKHRKCVVQVIFATKK